MRYLVSVEIGPVVDIIAAARKTRDHWYGSWMLSEIAKAIALAAAKHDICNGTSSLVAPAADEKKLADVHFAMGDELKLITKEGVSEPQVRKLADALRSAANDKYRDLANDSKEYVTGRLKGGATGIDAAQWNGQVAKEVRAGTAGDPIEVYVAWTPYRERNSQAEEKAVDKKEGDPDKDENPHQVSLRELSWLMAARTACRNFGPSTSREIDGRMKSSLDGRRDSLVGKDTRAGTRRATDEGPNPLRLMGGEQLDALGLVKRLALIPTPASNDGETQRFGKRRNYPSTARLAADPWIRGVANRQADQFSQLINCCNALARTGSGGDSFLGRMSTGENDFPTYPQFKAFPFEGAVLFETRHPQFLDEAGENEPPEWSDYCEQLRKLTRVPGVGEPGAYYAAIVADGDGVGNALSTCKSIEDHQRFSRALSDFATSMRELVESYHGSLIFAAGEDVSAFLPVDQVLPCCDAMRRQFTQMMEDAGFTGLTLSVGVAIGHFMDALDATLESAREMEGRAKRKPKNQIAIRYASRGGAPVACVYSWADAPLTKFNTWVDLLQNGDLPHKVAYELRRLAEFYDVSIQAEQKKGDGSSERILRVVAAMKADALRALGRKQSTAEAEEHMQIGNLADPSALRNLAATIVIAEQIAKAKRQASGE